MRHVLIVLAAVGIGVSTASRAAEQLDWTRCYSGTFTDFQVSKGAVPVFSWAENGIIMSNGENKSLNGAVTHCEGVQRGVGPERTGYGLCKVVDQDGDMIIAGGPYSGLTGSWPFLEGTGKWKGIKGNFHSQRIVRNKPLKSAMPMTYQGCRHERGSYELSK